jgi:DNA-3-methyladenine glycosylase
MRALAPDFYRRPVLQVARELIGCTVEHRGAAGVIVETEAYHDSEPACHAFAGETPRTRILFGPPGRAYVYRSYGVHAMLNAVCESEGVGAGVLIRALAPTAGLEQMRGRRELARQKRGAGPGLRGAGPALGAAGPALRDEDLCSGPGKLTQALGIELGENGSSLAAGPIRITPARAPWREALVVAGPRIGITCATELPWRFGVVGDRNVSRPRPRASAAAEPALAARTHAAGR